MDGTPNVSIRESGLVRDRSMIFWLGVGLALVVVLAKIALLPFEVATAGQCLRWCLRLSLVVAADLAFVLALACCCWLGAGLAAHRARTALIWRLGTLLAFEVAGVYAIVNVKILEVTTEMLSIRLLTFAGQPGIMFSSFAEYVSLPLMVAMAVVLVLPLGLRDQWRAARWTPQPGRRAWLALIILMATWCSTAQAYIAQQWHQPNRWERKIARNPHTVFLISCLEELANPDGFSDALLGEVDESDFLAPRPPTKPLPLPEGTQRPRNVLMIVMESVAAEYLKMGGSRHDTMPQLERLAAEKGVAFDNLYVQCPYSCNSLVSLTASIYPRCDGKVIARDNPDIRVPLIHEELARHGYRSCYLHSGFWSWKHRDKLFGRERQTKLIDAETLPGPFVNSWGVSDQQMYQAAFDWIDKKPDQPFFVLAFTIETHHPYVVPAQPEAFEQEPSFNRYLNALRKADESIAWLMRELARRGLEESTLVVVTSDHGESFGQHSQWVHGFGVYQPQIVVPLVMFHPSLRDMPRRTSDVRQQIDIAPTLLHLLGRPIPADWQGQSLFASGQPRAYFSALGVRFNFGLRDGKYKYHYYINSGVDELFDLSSDPDELTDLAASHPELCRQYRRRLAGLVRYQTRYLSQRGVK
jgi:arylsulfatase A-like enzyme